VPADIDSGGDADSERKAILDACVAETLTRARATGEGFDLLSDRLAQRVQLTTENGKRRVAIMGDKSLGRPGKCLSVRLAGHTPTVTRPSQSISPFAPPAFAGFRATTKSWRTERQHFRFVQWRRTGKRRERDNEYIRCRGGQRQHWTGWANRGYDQNKSLSGDQKVQLLIVRCPVFLVRT
jgi:hypothetical protein